MHMVFVLFAMLTKKFTIRLFSFTYFQSPEQRAYIGNDVVMESPISLHLMKRVNDSTRTTTHRNHQQQQQLHQQQQQQNDCTSTSSSCSSSSLNSPKPNQVRKNTVRHFYIVTQKQKGDMHNINILPYKFVKEQIFFFNLYGACHLVPKRGQFF